MRKIILSLAVIAMSVMLAACQSGDPAGQIGSELGLDLSGSTVTSKVEDHGFHGDGTTFDLLTFEDRGFSGNPWEAGEDRTYSLDALPQSSESGPSINPIFL